MNNTPHQVVGGRMFSSLNVQAVAVAKRHLYMLLLALLASYSMLFYVDRIWAPGKSIHFCDLYPRWYGARELLLAGAFLACSCVALRSNHLYVAGILLALATIKPQITALFAFWLLFWACCQWRNRKGVVIGFLVTIGALVGGAELLLPGWISE